MNQQAGTLNNRKNKCGPIVDPCEIQNAGYPKIRWNLGTMPWSLGLHDGDQGEWPHKGWNQISTRQEVQRNPDKRSYNLIFPLIEYSISYFVDCKCFHQSILRCQKVEKQVEDILKVLQWRTKSLRDFTDRFKKRECYFLKFRTIGSSLFHKKLEH